jgi:hypothetical protein
MITSIPGFQSVMLFNGLSTEKNKGIDEKEEEMCM